MWQSRNISGAQDQQQQFAIFEGHITHLKSKDIRFNNTGLKLTASITMVQNTLLLQGQRRLEQPTVFVGLKSVSELVGNTVMTGGWLFLVRNQATNHVVGGPPAGQLAACGLPPLFLVC